MLLDVIIPQALPMDHLTYIYIGVAQVGARVLVPLGKTKQIVGVVCRTREECGTDEEAKLRSVIALIDAYPIVNERLVDVYLFIAQYYITPLGGVVRKLLPAPLLGTKYAPSERLLKNRRKKIAPKYLDTPSQSVDLHQQTTLLVDTDTSHTHRTQVIASLTTDERSTTLVIAPNQWQTEKLAAQLAKYGPTVIYHPKISIKKRADIFIALATAQAPRFVVGTRSAVGLPFTNLGLVVVMDDYSFSYKSGNAPRYSGRDTAMMVAKIHKAKCLIMSHAPSVESFFNSTTIDSWAIEKSDNDLRSTELRSIALEHGKDLMSKYLQRRIDEELARGKQVVIFQNRRGWASSIECPACGYTPTCPACGCALALHKNGGQLLCHYCGYEQPYAEFCPVCSPHHSVRMEAHGRGTERLEEQLSTIFPTARLTRLDRDTSKKYEEIVQQFATQKADIIVGTQMIIDGIDFSNVGVIAVANADNLLSVADFRASEQAFRLLYSLALSARTAGAEIVIQTSSYDNEIIREALSDNPLEFYTREIQHRLEAHYPPFSRLVTLDMRSLDRTLLLAVAQGVEMALRSVFGEELSPLFQPQIERQAGEHIVKLLLKIDRRRPLVTSKQTISKLIAPIQRRYVRKVSIEIIVDPL